MLRNLKKMQYLQQLILHMKRRDFTCMKWVDTIRIVVIVSVGDGDGKVLLG